ncbi:MAG: molybdate ABC transporter substrate-binding protein [Alphaproteobacteria bacterium]
MRCFVVIACFVLLLSSLLCRQATASEALAAVAANFATAARALATSFQAESGHAVQISVGSTGKLYAQITRGAPYDLFLAADQARPELLEKDGAAVAGSRFTYAEGRLMYVGAMTPDLKGKLAIANPKLAPYGLAARQALEHVGRWQALQDRLVYGENIGQAFAMFATGNAQNAIIAMSQYVEHHRDNRTVAAAEIPHTHHDPIRQDAVLLRHGAENPAAKAFLAYLQQPTVQERIASFGYKAP